MDTLSPSERSERMSRVRSAHTKPEMLVRKLVFGMGYRYRLHRKDLPGKPDLVFPSRKKVIFVHGCFWHQHPDPTCRLSRVPKTRHEFWIPKFIANQNRDAAVLAELEKSSWKVLVIWECQLNDIEALRHRISAFLNEKPPF
ncbi:very short patch repair endonuclease [Pseudomonas aeruginosa]|uniref:very short patch repair endonuclease n=1 Tax=Pseudomonas aeruginosa TaxID=287 RepID=UPI0039837FCC